MNGKVALVTGAGTGIGKSTALAFAERGARVAICDLNVDAGEQTRAEIVENGGEALFVRADVSSSNDVKELIARTVDVFGTLDFAHNNAGVPPRKLCPIDQYPEDEWHQIIAVNLTGVWLCMKYEIAQMSKLGLSGAIVNTASLAGISGIAGSSAYTGAKHGVIGITKAAALEYAKADIRVNAVCPGYIRTPMIEQIFRKNKDLRGEEAVMKQIPKKRMGEPEEVAKAVIWLCSDEAAYITGHALTIDGGLATQGLGSSEESSAET